jgi:hypothetical protein
MMHLAAGDALIDHVEGLKTSGIFAFVALVPKGGRP